MTSRERRGRRWQEDPDLRQVIERLQVQLSQDLNALRESAGWSQDALATAAGVSPNTVLDLEQTRSDPHISTLVRLAFVFGCQLEVRFRRRSAERQVQCADLTQR